MMAFWILPSVLVDKKDSLNQEEIEDVDLTNSEKVSEFMEKQKQNALKQLNSNANLKDFLTGSFKEFVDNKFFNK